MNDPKWASCKGVVGIGGGGGGGACKNAILELSRCERSKTGILQGCGWYFWEGGGGGCKNAILELSRCERSKTGILQGCGWYWAGAGGGQVPSHQIPQDPPANPSNRVSRNCLTTAWQSLGLGRCPVDWLTGPQHINLLLSRVAKGFFSQSQTLPKPENPKP